MDTKPAGRGYFMEQKWYLYSWKWIVSSTGISTMQKV